MLSASGESPYDKSYFGDDQSARVAFHNQQMKERQEGLAERIRMGTRASNPRGVYDRIVKMAVRPRLDYNSTAVDMPFFRNYAAPTPLSGGVIKDYRYAQKLLSQRKQDYDNQAAAREGLPPTMSEAPLVLSDIQSKTLELNQLLTALDDAVEVGDISNLAVSDLKNVLRLMVSLSTTFDEARLVELIEYVENIITDLQTLADEAAAGTSTNRNARLVLKFFESMYRFLKGMAPAVNRSPQERALMAKSLVKEVLALKGRDLKDADEAIDDVIPSAPIEEIPEAAAPTEAEQPIGEEQVAEEKPELTKDIATKIKDLYSQSGSNDKPSAEFKKFYKDITGKKAGDKKNAALRNAFVRHFNLPKKFDRSIDIENYLNKIVNK